MTSTASVLAIPVDPTGRWVARLVTRVARVRVADPLGHAGRVGVSHRPLQGDHVKDYDKLYIDGAWVPPSGHRAPSRSSTRRPKQVIGRVPAGTPADVDRAVRRGQGRVRDVGLHRRKEERGKYLQAIAEGLAARSDEIAQAISDELGMPLMWANMIQAGLPVGNMAGYAQILDDFPFEEQVGNSLVVREPVGVVGAITPWNYPLHQIIAKVAPALAAGCTVVLKPSEVTPLNAFILAEIIDSVGPARRRVQPGHRHRSRRRRGHRLAPRRRHGLVHRLDPGRQAGHRAGRPDGQAGAPRAGRQVGQRLPRRRQPRGRACPGRHLRLLPQLGPDLLGAHPHGRAPRQAGRDRGPGQGRRPRAITVGPGDSDAQLGPLVSATQRDRVRGYIQKGIDEGATLVTGGVDAPEGLDTGYFVQPTVFADVTTDMTIAQEEIFGPVLVIMPYDDEDDALRIANATIYGLSGGGAVRRRRAGQGVRPQDAHRPGRTSTRAAYNIQAPVRRLQAVGQRPRARQVRSRGVPRDQVPAASLTAGGRPPPSSLANLP